MFRTQGLLPNVQGPLEEQYRFRMLAQLSVENGQVIKQGGHVRMFRTPGLLPDVQGLLEERLRFQVLRSSSKIPCDLEQQGSQVWLRGLPGRYARRTGQCMGQQAFTR